MLYLALIMTWRCGKCYGFEIFIDTKYDILALEMVFQELSTINKRIRSDYINISKKESLCSSTYPKDFWIFLLNDFFYKQLVFHFCRKLLNIWLKISRRLFYPSYHWIGFYIKDLISGIKNLNYLWKFSKLPEPLGSIWPLVLGKWIAYKK